MKLDFVLELQGGGSKVDAHMRVKQQVVTFLLQCGADAVAVNSYVRELFEKAGLNRLQHALAIRDTDERFSHFQNLAKAMQISPISFADPESDRAKKVKAWKPKAVPADVAVQASNFAIAEDTFATPDGKSVPCLPAGDPGREGIMLVDANEAVTIAQSSEPKPPAFAICVLGPECPLSHAGCHRIHVPAADRHGMHVILKGCLHQCGSTTVSLRAKQGDDIKVENSCLTSITAWKPEMTEQLWEQLLKNPARTCATVLSLKPADHYCSSPWGRTFRDEHQPCEPEAAVSFQYHCRIRESALQFLMKRSGREGVYITPKSETLSRADEKFMVIWHPESTWTQVKAFADSLECQLGLARSTTGSLHYGVRVHADNFTEVYTKAFPTKSPPNVLITHFLAKVSPTPVGATADNLREWLKAQGLRGKPVRALNTSTWLISTVERVSQQFLTWHGNSVLLTPIQSRIEKTRPTVMAGKKRQDRADAISDDFEDPWMSEDPWSRWSSESKSTASSSSSDRTGGETTTKMTQQMTHQQKEMQSMKTKLQNLEAKLDQKEQTDQAWKTAVSRDVRAFKDEVKTDLQRMETQYQNSLESALARTESKISASVQDSIQKLQQFMIEQSKQQSGKRHTPPSPAKSEDADMRPVP